MQIDSLKQSLSGRVTQIIPSANPSSRSFTIKIALSTAYGLMPGMFGRLELPRSSRSALVIPNSSLIRRGQLEGVYVINANHQATLRWIKTGKFQGDRVEITSGLSDGDRIITNHLAQLSDEQKVVIQH